MAVAEARAVAWLDGSVSISYSVVGRSISGSASIVRCNRAF